MPRPVLDPFASAKRLNPLASFAEDVYRETVRADLRSFLQDGYVVGTEPAKSLGEAIAALRLQLPQAIEIVNNPEVDAGPKKQASDVITEFVRLNNQLQGSSGVPAQT